MADDKTIKTIRLASEEGLEAHKKLKAYAALIDKNMGEAFAEVMNDFDITSEVSQK
jgi:hypothetical protein